MRRLALALLPLLLALPAGTAAAAATSPPPVKHVFVITLENKGFQETFGPNSPATYLNKTLVPSGKLLTQYYATGHVSLDNYISMVSGQPPNPQTQADCQSYNDWVGSNDAMPTGTGCVYPAAVKTIGDQLDAAGLTWKGYMEDMGNDPARDNGTNCAHPDLNTSDKSQTASATDQYATRHNPFVYFHSITDNAANCNAKDVPLSHLPTDLGSDSTTANYSFITPDLCGDGHDATCADGGPGGFSGIDRWLQNWVPQILSSPAYHDNGLLMITFDEAEPTGASADSTACCNEQPGPNTPAPGQTGPGGGRTGALVISPFVRPGTTSTTPYNHYSFLRSVEDVFGLAHLGMAAADGLQPFGTDVYDNQGALITRTSGPGYRLFAADGGVFTYNAPFAGSAGAIKLNQPIVGGAPSASGNGYLLAAKDGGIFNYGDAPFAGSLGSMHLNQPIVGVATTPTGGGYWLVAADGGIFAFGDAAFLGSMGGTKLNQPVVGMAATPTGKGYWLVARDGGIFAFGDAGFQGSEGGTKLNQPVVGMAANPVGTGYWMVAKDGGIFAFGDAQFAGSEGARRLNQPIVGMAVTPTGNGYWLVAADGGVFTHGFAPFLGSAGGIKLNSPIVGMG